MKKHIWLILLGALGLHNVTYAVKKRISPVDRRESHECDFCEKQFSTKRLCEYHEATHTNKGNFACNSCSDCFIRKKDLEDHNMKIHKTDFFFCDICTRKYARFNDLTSHQKQHLEKTSFFCQTCHLFLKSNPGLKNHIRVTDHGEIFDRRKVAEPSAADTPTQSYATEPWLNDADLATLTALIMNDQDMNQFLIDFDPDFMEANTRQANSSDTVTTDDFEKLPIEHRKDRRITRSISAQQKRMLANQKK